MRPFPALEPERSALHSPPSRTRCSTLFLKLLKERYRARSSRATLAHVEGSFVLLRVCLRRVPRHRDVDQPSRMRATAFNFESQMRAWDSTRFQRHAFVGGSTAAKASSQLPPNSTSAFTKLNPILRIPAALEPNRHLAVAGFAADPDPSSVELANNPDE